MPRRSSNGRRLQRSGGNAVRGVRSGVTLIELTAIIVVLGIVGAVTVPALVRSEIVDPVGAATAPLVELLHFAAQSAAQRNSPVTVTIDPATGAYHVAANDADSALADGVLALPAFGHLATDSARARFVFNPGGVGYADSILVTTDGGRALMRVDPWSGAVDVARW